MAATGEVEALVDVGWLRLELDLKGDLLVDGLAEVLGVFSRRWRAESPEGTRLVIRDVRRGSLIIEFGVALAVGAAALAGGANVLFDFAKNLEESVKRIKGWGGRGPLEPNDHQLARALTVLTEQGLTVTISGQMPGKGSVYARVSPDNLSLAAARLPEIAGPPTVQMPDEPRTLYNIRLWLVEEGDGVLAFAPEASPRALPFEGVPLPEREDRDEGGWLLPVAQMRSLVTLTADGPIPDRGSYVPKTDDSLRHGRPGQCYRVDVQVIPGDRGAAGLRILAVHYNATT